MSIADAIANRRATPVKGGIPRSETVIAAQVVPHTRVRRPRVATFKRGPGDDMEIDSTLIEYRDPHKKGRQPKLPP
jgi:hypothetical protein